MAVNSVKLYRYESVAASRSIPNMNDIMKGKIEVNDDAKFAIDVEKNAVQVNGEAVFDRLVYTVNA